MDELIAPVIGYVYAVIGGHLAIRPFVDRLWRSLGWTGDTESTIRADAYLPRIVGLVERTLFVASLQLGKTEFIGVWIALKAAGQWKRWGETRGGTAVYNIFLIGSGLSVAYAVVGAQMIEFLKKPDWLLGLGLPVALLVATYVLALLVEDYQKASVSNGTPKDK